MEGKNKYLNADHMSAALKFATTALNNPSLKGIPIDRVDTHSLRSGGANALSLAVYSDRDIKKNGNMERGNFQGVHKRGVKLFCGGNVDGNEAGF